MISQDPTKSLPHREPFLWVHELLSRNEHGTEGLCLLRLSPEAAIFKGHFPDFPVFPGVLQIEAAAQAALWVLTGATPTQIPRGLLASVEAFKFKKTLEPPATVEITVREQRARGPLRHWEATLTQNNAVISQGSFWLSVAFVADKK